MQTVSQVMTRQVQFVSPQESLQRAAQMMDELNVGALPVCEGEQLVGMITDRDITIRATAAGKAPAEAKVEEAMSADVRWCFEDQSLDEVMQQMADTQIRRVPVVSHDDQHKLIGIVALGDLATKTSDNAQKQGVQQVVEQVSSPAAPDRPQANMIMPDNEESGMGEGLGITAGAGVVDEETRQNAAGNTGARNARGDDLDAGVPVGSEAVGAPGATMKPKGSADTLGPDVG